jgi:hypothetical protein
MRSVSLVYHQKETRKSGFSASDFAASARSLRGALCTSAQRESKAKEKGPLASAGPSKIQNTPPVWYEIGGAFCYLRLIIRSRRHILHRRNRSKWAACCVQLAM